jgi:hypothetical protein
LNGPLVSSSLQSPALDSRHHLAEADERARSWQRWREPAIVVSVLLVGMIAALLAIVIRTREHFFYTLDAAYIHMALADQIAAGNYGINPGEAAAPSSTIIYPFLLALVSRLGAGQYAALTINVLSTFATGLLVCELARECDLRIRELSAISLAVLTASVALAMNLIGLAFSGLEHSLHVALTVASLLGLIRFVRRREADWWWLLCIALQPLVRFEAAVLLIADIGVLLVFRKYRHAATVALIGIVCVGGFGLYLHSLGLSWLPSSVLSRSEVASAGVGMSPGSIGGFVVKVILNLNNNLDAYGGAQIAVMIAALLATFTRVANPLERFRQEPVKASVAAFAALVSVAHLAGGSLSSFSRYEIYAMMLSICALAVVYREALNDWLRNSTFLGHLIVAAMLIFVFSGYARRTLVTPGAAANIYEQQFQMRRFVAQFYQGPVAVNHLGAINYRNPEYVLDLGGTGLESVRKAIVEHKSGQWMEKLVADHGIGLAIMYPTLEPPAPPSWRAVAQLGLNGRSHSAAGEAVTFYATREEEVPIILDKLRHFAPTLPPGVPLTILPQASHS